MSESQDKASGKKPIDEVAQTQGAGDVYDTVDKSHFYYPGKPTEPAQQVSGQGAGDVYDTVDRSHLYPAAQKLKKPPITKTEGPKKIDGRINSANGDRGECPY